AAWLGRGRATIICSRVQCSPHVASAVTGTGRRRSLGCELSCERSLMPQEYRCAKGHTWQPDGDAITLPEGVHPLCPVCGAAAEADSLQRPDASTLTRPVAQYPNPFNILTLPHSA